MEYDDISSVAGNASSAVAAAMPASYDDISDIIKPSSSDNNSDGFFTNLTKGVVRGAGQGMLPLAKAIGAVTPEQAAQVSKNFAEAGQNGGIGGDIGSVIGDPRYAALGLIRAPALGLAALPGVIGKVGGILGRTASRGALGAGAGYSDVPTTTNPDQADAERTQNALNTGTAFMGAPVIGKAAELALGTAGKVAGTLGGRAIQRLLPEDAPQIFPSREDTSENSMYDRVAGILGNEGITPEKLTQATTNSGAGVPLTLPEALQSKSLLGKQQVMAQGSNPSAVDFQNFNENRLRNALPEAKQDLTEQVAGGVPSSLTDAGAGLQDTASKILENKRTELRSVGSGYAELQGTKLPSESLISARANPLVDEAFGKVTGNDAMMERQYQFAPQLPADAPLVKQTVGGLEPDSFGAWQKIKQQLDAEARAQINTYGRASPLGAQYTAASQAVRGMLEDTEGKYADLNKIYGTTRQGVVDMENSPIGKIAAANDPERAARIFMGLSKEQAQQIVPQLKEINPKAIQDMSGAIMQDITEKAPEGNIAGYLRAMGSTSQGDVAFRKEQLRALMGDDAVNAQEALADRLQKIQSGQPRGSNTEANMQTRAEINNNIPLQQIVSTLQSGTPAQSAAMKLLNYGVKKAQLRMNNATQQQMMQVFLNPDIEKLGTALENAKTEAQKNNLALEYVGRTISAGAQPKAITSQPQETPKLIGAPQPAAQPSPQASQAPAPDDSGLLHKIAMVESGGNQNARSPNPNSSASGMFGINNQTWRYLVGKYGQQLGVTMGDRMNPKAQAVMTQAYMNENRQTLTKALGREPQPHELYLAHFLGAQGATRLLTNMQNTQIAAARLLPQAAQENPGVFFNKGVPLNSAQVSQKVQARLGV